MVLQRLFNNTNICQRSGQFMSGVVFGALRHTLTRSLTWWRCQLVTLWRYQTPMSTQWKLSVTHFQFAELMSDLGLANWTVSTHYSAVNFIKLAASVRHSLLLCIGIWQGGCVINWWQSQGDSSCAAFTNLVRVGVGEFNVNQGAYRKQKTHRKWPISDLYLAMWLYVVLVFRKTSHLHVIYRVDL